MKQTIIKIFAIIFILLNVTGYITGQSDSESLNYSDIETFRQSFPDERVIVKTDRDIYLCGEEILLSALTIERNWFLPVSISSVLYVELYNQENRVISRNKLLMRNGTGAGMISIPKNVSTGVYYLRAYTNYMKNFGVEHFYLKKMKIVNPFVNSGLIGKISPDTRLVVPDTISSESVSSVSSGSVPGVHFKYFTITLQPEKQLFNNREKVNVSVRVSDSKGDPVKTNLVIFARLSENDSIKSINPFTVRDFLSGESQKLYPVSVKYLPETYGDIISGKLIYSDNRPASGIELQQSFTGNAGCIESTKTDSKGNFNFLTSNEMNRGDLILRINNPVNNLILIPDNEFFDMFPPPGNEPFTISRNEAAMIAKQFINIQVADAFPDTLPIVTNTSDPDLIPFYGKEYTEFKFSDYARLPNMREFIFEVIVGVVVTKENKKDKIVILDAGSVNNLGSNPLMMIDGIPVAGASLILGLNPEEVKSVRVVRSRYYYKNQVFDGILDILTFNGNARSLILPDDTFRYGFIHAEEFASVIEPVFRSGDEARLPVYRNLLYWNPHISTDSEGTAKVTFYTPDNSGQFTIECFGFTPEGMAGEGSCTITVGSN